MKSGVRPDAEAVIIRALNRITELFVTGQRSWGKQKNLHHGPRRERVNDRSCCRFDFRGCFAHPAARNPMDLLPQVVGGVRKELPMKLLDARRADRTLRQSLFSRRQRVMKRDDQHVVVQDDRHRLWRVARPLLLMTAGHSGELLRDIRIQIHFVQFGFRHDGHPAAKSNCFEHAA